MLHQQLDNGGHYAVSRPANPGTNGVLVQLGDSYGDQARVFMTRDEAIAFATQVLERSRLEWQPDSMLP